MLAAETKVAVLPVRCAPPLDSRGLWKEIVDPVEPFLELVAHRLSDQVQAFELELARYARYALTNQGKQLRPVLVALSGGVANKANPNLVTLAVIIEMVHLATLVHDDVMDEAELRRRRPTLAAHWGNKISVLLGDCLFAQAVKLAASFPTPDVCRAVASATHTVCSGEILQNQQRGNLLLSRAEYFRILGMKTAELFALSCDLGSGITGGRESQRSALRQYGVALGTAYQVYDDCLDLFGTEALAGKTLGTDLANGQLTLPVLVLLERAEEADQVRIRELIQSGAQSTLHPLRTYLEKYDALSESRRVVHQYIRAAKECLPEVPGPANRAGLHGLTDFLAQLTDALGVGS